MNGPSYPSHEGWRLIVVSFDAIGHIDKHQFSGLDSDLVLNIYESSALVACFYRVMVLGSVNSCFWLLYTLMSAQWWPNLSVYRSALISLAIFSLVPMLLIANTRWTWWTKCGDYVPCMAIYFWTVLWLEIFWTMMTCPQLLHRYITTSMSFCLNSTCLQTHHAPISLCCTLMLICKHANYADIWW